MVLCCREKDEMAAKESKWREVETSAQQNPRYSEIMDHLCNTVSAISIDYVFPDDHPEDSKPLTHEELEAKASQPGAQVNLILSAEIIDTDARGCRIHHSYAPPACFFRCWLTCFAFSTGYLPYRLFASWFTAAWTMEDWYFFR